MLRSTIGQILINSALPEDMRDYDRVLDKKAIKALLQEVAETDPDKYSDIAKNLSDVGRTAAYSTGGYSVGLRHMRATVAARRTRLELGRAVDKINSDRSLTDTQREHKVLKIVGKYQQTLADEVMDEARSNNNPLARQADTGMRGNKFNVNSLLGADLLYTNHRDEPIALPVLRSYAQGMTPVEYFASSFGARKGVMDLAGKTQEAGFFAKQLAQATHRLLVSALDDDDEYDEASPRGLPVDSDDPDNAGAYLSHPVGGYPRNTELTPKILKDLKSRGHDRILVRSPTVGGPRDGGVYAHDVGVRDRGGISPVGDYVGLSAGQALSEPITQSQISSKHSGGIAGASAGAISGFQRINQLVQVPKTFRGGAAHAQLDGRVQHIQDAPQGGTYVTIDGEKHYVGRGFEVRVKPGDDVEAGDMISEGVPNPAEIVRHKGIGEGREYFIRAFRQSLLDANTTGDRRNIELVARGLINHVRLTDEVGDWVPDDVLPYQTLERLWKPRPGHSVIDPRKAVGKYLERPVLHYTVGTKIRKSMLPTLKQFGANTLVVHNDPPPFQPEMVRGMANVSHDPDWMARFMGSYQQKSLLEGARRGDTSNEAGSSFVPALAAGANFGRTGLTKGWNRDAKLTE